jgi:hypothetical protein
MYWLYYHQFEFGQTRTRLHCVFLAGFCLVRSWIFTLRVNMIKPSRQTAFAVRLGTEHFS